METNTVKDEHIIDMLFAAFSEIRYVALYRYGTLASMQREAANDTSSSESDRYEELLVNPVLITAASQRGNIDCGGLAYIIIRYGNFFQLVKAIAGGHISLCLDKHADISKLPVAIEAFLQEQLTD